MATKIKAKPVLRAAVKPKVKTIAAAPRVKAVAVVTRVKTSAPPSRSRAVASDFGTELLQAPVHTTEDRIARIQTLSHRVEGYVMFICKIGKLNGTSMESKDRAVAVFYDRMVSFERELDRIQEEVRLG